MTDRRISLVAVKHKDEHNRCFLFEAPRFCGLKVGETVLVDTQYGEDIGKVVAVEEYVQTNSEIYEFIIKAMGATEPLKRIVGRYKKYEYEGVE